jgi:hypothetical protein
MDTLNILFDTCHMFYIRFITFAIHFCALYFCLYCYEVNKTLKQLS